MEGGSQPQFFSTAAESEDKESGRSLKRLTLSQHPTLLETLALCYLGILLLRLPISPADIQSWAASGSLLYNHAIADIPEAMRLPLEATYLQSLETQVVLRPGDVQSAIRSLSGAYQREYQMQLPSVNMSILLYRYVKELALPLEIYPCVRSLASIFEYPFTYSVKEFHIYQSIPDLQILSLIIIATKLLYPISKSRLYPTTSTEPASLSMNWQTWLSAKRAHDVKFRHPERLSYANAYAASEADVFTWNDSQMDDYLAWYEGTWAKTEPAADDDFREALFDMFPIGTDAPLTPVPESLDANLTPNKDALEASQRERVRAVQAGLRPRKVVSEEDAARRAENHKLTPRPGSIYRQYKSIGDLEGPNSGDGAMKALYEQGSEMVAMPLETMIGAVYMMEGAFIDWTMRERKRERAEQRRKENEGAEKEQLVEEGENNRVQDENDTGMERV